MASIKFFFSSILNVTKELTENVCSFFVFKRGRGGGETPEDSSCPDQVEHGNVQEELAREGSNGRPDSTQSEVCQ